MIALESPAPDELTKSRTSENEFDTMTPPKPAYNVLCLRLRAVRIRKYEFRQL